MAESSPPGPSTGSLPQGGANPPKKRIRRKPKAAPVAFSPPSLDPKVQGRGKGWSGVMEFGSFSLPLCKEYYLTHRGLASHDRLTPLLPYPVEVLANCRNYRREQGRILGWGKAILYCPPPSRHAALSVQEFYALYAEDLLKFFSRRQAEDPKAPEVRRYRRNLEVLRFLRATWDALLIGYQAVRQVSLARYGTFALNSLQLQGVNRFRAQLIDHPLEAAKRLKDVAAANRKWFYGGPRPGGRLLVVPERRWALLVSYVARGLPPAPPSPDGLQGLIGRLTSDPAPEHPRWREFVASYLDKFKPLKPAELYTMPSPSAALGLPRSSGGHGTGVQHLVLLGYAVAKVHGRQDPVVPPLGDPDRDDGSWLELLSDALHPASQLKQGKMDPAYLLFRRHWDELEAELPGSTRYLQKYLRIGVDYVLENLEYVPILPISADEKGLKTRFPTCSLTAVNLVQQVLRRVIDHYMVNDPRFSRALGGDTGIDLSGECGPWYSQDATAATDYHPQWLTQTVYEELAKRDLRLAPYTKWFDKLFGAKKLLTGYRQGDLAPLELLAHYPRAPLLDDRYITMPSFDWHEDSWGHASIILDDWNKYLNYLNSLTGEVTKVGQMMGDPTSFPPLMLLTTFCGEEAIRAHPYTRRESRRHYRGLRKGDVVVEGVGDDALFPRWSHERRTVYDTVFSQMGGQLSVPKSFWHIKYGLIAEVPTEHGRKLPHWPLSILVAPPGGTKGQVTWVTQPASLAGDPGTPQYVFSALLTRCSPYYYTWMLADKMGIPLAAPQGYGGIGLSKVFPVRSTTHQVEWLRYLSSLSLEELIVGTALSLHGNTGFNPLSFAVGTWLKDVLREQSELQAVGMDLLSSSPLDDSGYNRLSLSDAYRKALSSVRSAEFYFRTPPENQEYHAPSVRVSAARFQRKVSRAPFIPGSSRWTRAGTFQDLERKLALFFVRQGTVLPKVSDTPRSFFGLEQTGTVKRRYKAPWITGLG